MIARGAPPPSYVTKNGIFFAVHDGLEYQVQVRCFDRTSRLLAACGGEAVSAQVTAVWGGAIHMPRFEAALFHEALWRLRGLDGAEAWVTGTSWSSYATTFGPTTHDATVYWVTTDKEITLIWDPWAMQVRAGSQTAEIAVDRQQAGADDRASAMTGAIVFDRADRVTLTLDDRIYWIDRSTGETTIATELE
ncbi:MAG TPA: hypothetical protein VLB44_27535 [Kofleriaceae bacterium]|nr:hypothetical protein [Kofleriaceae bacterium]